MSDRKAFNISLIATDPGFGCTEPCNAIKTSLKSSRHNLLCRREVKHVNKTNVDQRATTYKRTQDLRPSMINGQTTNPAPILLFTALRAKYDSNGKIWQLRNHRGNNIFSFEDWMLWFKSHSF